jgi:hypothetical protein
MAARTKTMKISKALLAIAAALAIVAPCAIADSYSTTTTTTRGFTGPGAPANPPPFTNTNANAVFLGGTAIFRVRVSGGGLSPEQRASRIQNRLNDILGSGPVSPNDITVSPIGGEAAVYVKGKLMFTADTATARYNQSTPMALANTWADHLRKVLPGLTEAK